MRAELQRRGLRRHQADMLVAATAAAHGLTLATRNHRDFEGFLSRGCNLRKAVTHASSTEWSRGWPSRGSSKLRNARCRGSSR